ncbi:Thioredoxin H1 [Camellia lanceoleosa]|uniref:Thioredoxin H1 n=1 Tax=Camellia lanceoleosa TaxID=1840588 RepID=A0ACC0FAB9_9ERIC|nr:Thioredoxin H1 [Camellia lanceoleosa]
MNEVVQRHGLHGVGDGGDIVAGDGVVGGDDTGAVVGAEVGEADGVVVGDGTGDGEGDDVASEGDTVFGIVFSLSINLFQFIKRVRDYFNYYFQYPKMASEEGQLISYHTLDQWNSQLQTAEDSKKLVF